MQIQITSYSPTKGLRFSDDIAELPSHPRDGSVWVDLWCEEEHHLASIAKHFNLHELAVEDCMTAGHFPKMEEFGTYLFLILRAVNGPIELQQSWDQFHGPEATKSNTTNEHEAEQYTSKVALFLGDNFLVTFRRHEVPWLDAIVRYARQNPDTTIARGPDVLAHQILDVLADRFERGMVFFEKVIEKLELQAISKTSEFEMMTALTLKGELTTLRQILRDERSVVLKLATDPLLKFARIERRYFKDVDDHFVEIGHSVDRLIDNVAGLRDAYFALANVQLSDTMKVLAVITAVAAPVNILVGLYGMNFHDMPLLSHPYGFWIMVLVMTATTLSLLIYFRRKRWI